MLEKQQTYKLFELILTEHWSDTSTLPYINIPPSCLWVGIVQTVQWQATSWMVRSSNTGGLSNFHFCTPIHTNLGSMRLHLPCVPRPFSWDKSARTWRWPSTPFSTEVKNMWKYTFFPPPCHFMACYRVLSCPPGVFLFRFALIPDFTAYDFCDFCHARWKSGVLFQQTTTTWSA